MTPGNLNQTEMETVNLMNQPADYHRAAIILGVLGDSERETVLSAFQTPVADRLREQLQQFDQEPPGLEARDETLEEFQRTLRFALAALPEVEEESEAADEPELSLFTESEENTEQFICSSDPVADLTRLQPFQLLLRQHPQARVRERGDARPAPAPRFNASSFAAGLAAGAGIASLLWWLA